MPSPPPPSARGLLARVTATAIVLVVGLWATFYWMESERELRVLCAQVEEGAPVEEVRAMFDTGLYLRSRLVMDDGGDRWIFDSARSLGQATCTVRLAGSDRVEGSAYAAEVSLPSVASRLALPLLGGMAFFQLALALGAPIGHLAWGGAHRRLPPRLRGASAVVSLVFVGAVLTVLAAVGRVGWLARTGAVSTALWILVVVFGFSALANSASSRPQERWVGIPVATLLCLCCAVLALTF